MARRVHSCIDLGGEYFEHSLSILTW
jgi:hypothetical protein